MDKIIVVIGGFGLVALICWFFFGKKEENKSANEEASGSDNTIIVEGGYSPAVIYVQKDKPKSLTFIRKDSNSCLEEIVFPDYKIKNYLPLNTEVKITLNPPHKEGDFHCGMNMFFGKVKIEK